MPINNLRAGLQPDAPPPARGAASTSGDVVASIVSSPETVTLAGSQLRFVNTYSSQVTEAYHTAVLFAEHELQSHFTDNVTITVSFGFQDLGPQFLAQNSFGNLITASYADLKAALRAHATTADDIASVNTLPAADPSGGAGFLIAGGMARLLGLPGAGTSSTPDVTLVLGQGITWNFDPNNRNAAGEDAIGAIEHEITEGGFGRVGGLGIQNHAWAPLDLFRYSSAGHRDFTGGTDGLPTFFSVDGTQMLHPFHNAMSTAGVFDGSDFGDWDIAGDSFGFGKEGTPGLLSAVDLRVLDVLGWTPKGATPRPPTDDFRDSLTDATRPFGSVAVGKTATGNLEAAGDRDWFRVQLAAGATYVLALEGVQSAHGTLQDPYLRLHNSAGTVLAQNDDIVAGVNRDSQLRFTAPSAGTYYLEAGAFDDGFAGTYRVSVVLAAPADDFRDTLTDKGVFGRLSSNGSATGHLEINGDRDWFAVQLTAGQSYQITMLGSRTNRGTLADPNLRVHDSSGRLLTQNDDIVEGINRDSQVTITAARSGIYYVEAGAFNDSATGSYTVNVRHLAIPDDFADSRTDRTHHFGTVAINGSATGKLEVIGDRDWFQVHLIAGKGYLINLKGEQSGGGTLEDPYLRLHGSTGSLVAQNDDIVLGVNHDSRIVYVPTVTGTYFLDVGSYLDNYTGTYKLIVQDDTAPVITSNGGGASASLSRAENTTVVTQVTASDHEPHTTFTYSIVGGADALKFQINSHGVLSFVTAPDFEQPGDSDHNNSYVVRVSVTDNGTPQLSDTQTITVRVTDANEPSRDFDRDGHSDLLLREDDGSVLQWDMLSGGRIKSHFDLGVLATAWHIMATGDFNGDGNADVLFRHNDGTVGEWDMNGGHVLASHSLGLFSTASRIMGTGDFNGDGRSDILWRDGDGSVVIWDMLNGGQVEATHNLGAIAAVWHIIGTGDFNGDGHSDILWRANDGSLVEWDMLNGGQVKTVNDLGTLATSWHLEGTGDFNGDHRTDLLWHGDDGRVLEWDMRDGGHLLAHHDLGVMATTRHVADVGDFNGDGHSDILWQGPDGHAIAWDMQDGGHILAHYDLGIIATTRHIAAQGNFDFV